MNNGHSALAVANAFIRIARKAGKQLTHMQLQKLVFFSQSFALGMLDRPMYSGHTEAWKYGPVIPELYHALKRFGHEEVDGLIATDDRVVPGSVDEELIEQIYNECKGKTGGELSAITHKKDSPWSVARERGEPIISHAIMREHFEKCAEEEEENESAPGSVPAMTL